MHGHGQICPSYSELFYQPRIIDDDECGAVGGMRIAGETEILGENLS
jgi:hypothetical protein